MLALSAPPVAAAPRRPAPVVVSPAEVASRISADVGRVAEFNFLADHARSLGVRAWLFGGTAAAFGHYSRWNLQRERGDSRFQSDRFDFDYTNIFRSNQDFDIVIDGTPEQAAKLTELLQAHYPHLQGSKPVWEVRLLRASVGDKEALLDNPDFLSQHSDSNSTGLIEVSDPPAGELRVRDIRQWDRNRVDAPTEFLRDLAEAKLHYYYSKDHDATSRAKQGLNPPILSAIRYLTKAFQYELTLRPEDRAAIAKVVDDFSPSSVAQSEYVAGWIEKNGKKLIQNAVNNEYAWETLQALGLRQKLIAIRPMDIGKEDSLAWWMNRQPLRTKKVGGGLGRTAAQLGITEVAHETNSVAAYESISRAHTGDPNVLVSRENTAGEHAVHGEGFYTKIGREGAAGSGLTLRFEVDPKAREGTDFVLIRELLYVIWLNRTAIRLKPESLKMTPVEYFRILTSNQSQIHHSDRGLLEKLRRRINARATEVSREDRDEIHRLVEKAIEAEADPVARTQKVRLYLGERLAADHPRALEWCAGALRAKPGIFADFFVDRILPRFPSGSPERAQWLLRLLQAGDGDGVAAVAREMADPKIGAALLREVPEMVSILSSVAEQEGAGQEPEVTFTRELGALYLSPTIQALPESVDWVEKLLRGLTQFHWEAWWKPVPLDARFAKELALRFEGKPLRKGRLPNHATQHIPAYQLRLARRLLSTADPQADEKKDPVLRAARGLAKRMQNLQTKGAEEVAFWRWDSDDLSITAEEIRRLGIEEGWVQGFAEHCGRMSGSFIGDDPTYLRALSIMSDLGRLTSSDIDFYLSLKQWNWRVPINLRKSIALFPAIFPQATEAQRAKMLEILNPPRGHVEFSGDRVTGREFFGPELYDQVSAQLGALAQESCLATQLKSVRQPATVPDR